MNGEDFSCDTDHGRCITCGDIADELTVLGVDAATGLALCSDSDGAETEVDTLLVEPVAPGDRILVHAATAIARVEREPVS